MPSRIVDACREVNDHPKALFRRATAHAALMNYEAALEDFRLCRDVSPAMAKDVDRYNLGLGFRILRNFHVALCNASEHAQDLRQMY